MAGNSNAWPPEKRARMAEMIKQRKPWLKSTGPKTDAGKEAVRGNAHKHGFRSREHAALLTLLKAQDAFIKALALPSEQG